MKTENRLASIVRRYRAEMKMSVRAFAKALNKGLEDKISYASVNYWENGKNGIRYEYLMYLVENTDDWRHEFALDCLAARSNFYSPLGNIGCVILEGQNENN